MGILAVCFTFGKYQRPVKQDKSSTPTLALDLKSCFVPAALRFQLSWACSGSALPGVWAQLPPSLCGAGLCHLGIPMQGFAKGSQGKTISLWLGLNNLCYCHLQLPWKAWAVYQIKMVKPWDASGQQMVPGRGSQEWWHQCLCVSLHSALPYTSGTVWIFSQRVAQLLASQHGPAAKKNFQDMARCRIP